MRLLRVFFLCQREMHSFSCKLAFIVCGLWSGFHRISVASTDVRMNILMQGMRETIYHFLLTLTMLLLEFIQK